METQDTKIVSRGDLINSPGIDVDVQDPDRPQNWAVRVYDTDGWVIAHWLILNRTEHDAEREAEADLQNVQDLGTADTSDWTLTPIGDSRSLPPLPEMQRQADMINRYPVEIGDIRYHTVYQLQFRIDDVGTGVTLFPKWYDRLTIQQSMVLHANENYVYCVIYWQGDRQSILSLERVMAESTPTDKQLEHRADMINVSDAEDVHDWQVEIFDSEDFVVDSWIIEHTTHGDAVSQVEHSGLEGIQRWELTPIERPYRPRHMVIGDMINIPEYPVQPGEVVQWVLMGKVLEGRSVVVDVGDLEDMRRKWTSVGMPAKVDGPVCIFREYDEATASGWESLSEVLRITFSAERPMTDAQRATLQSRTTHADMINLPPPTDLSVGDERVDNAMLTLWRVRDIGTGEELVFSWGYALRPGQVEYLQANSTDEYCLLEAGDNDDSLLVYSLEYVLNETHPAEDDEDEDVPPDEHVRRADMINVLDDSLWNVGDRYTYGGSNTMMTIVDRGSLGEMRAKYPRARLNHLPDHPDAYEDDQVDSWVSAVEWSTATKWIDVELSFEHELAHGNMKRVSSLTTVADMINVAQDLPPGYHLGGRIKHQNYGLPWTLLDVGIKSELMHKYLSMGATQTSGFDYLLKDDGLGIAVETYEGVIFLLHLKTLTNGLFTPLADVDVVPTRTADMINLVDPQVPSGFMIGGQMYSPSLGRTLTLIELDTKAHLQAKWPDARTTDAFRALADDDMGAACERQSDRQMSLVSMGVFTMYNPIPPRPTASASVVSSAFERTADMINLTDSGDALVVGQTYFWGRPDQDSKYTFIDRGTFDVMYAKYPLAIISNSKDSKTYQSHDVVLLYSVYSEQQYLIATRVFLENATAVPPPTTAGLRTRTRTRTADMITRLLLPEGFYIGGDIIVPSSGKRMTLIDVGTKKDLLKRYPAGRQSNNFKTRTLMSDTAAVLTDAVGDTRLMSMKIFKVYVPIEQYKPPTRRADMINAPGVVSNWPVGTRYQFTGGALSSYTIVDYGLWEDVRGRHQYAKAGRDILDLNELYDDQLVLCSLFDTAVRGQPVWIDLPETLDAQEQAGDIQRISALNVQSDMINLLPEYGLEIGEVLRWKNLSWSQEPFTVVDVGPGMEIAERWSTRLHPKAIDQIVTRFADDVIVVTEDRPIGGRETRFGYDTLESALSETYSTRRPRPRRSSTAARTRTRRQADMINVEPDYPLYIGEVCRWRDFPDEDAFTVLDVGDPQRIYKHWRSKFHGGHSFNRAILAEVEPVCVLQYTAGGWISWALVQDMANATISDRRPPKRNRRSHTRVADMINVVQDELSLGERRMWRTDLGLTGRTFTLVDVGLGHELQERSAQWSLDYDRQASLRDERNHVLYVLRYDDHYGGREGVEFGVAPPERILTRSTPVVPGAQTRRADMINVVPEDDSEEIRTGVTYLWEGITSAAFRVTDVGTYWALTGRNTNALDLTARYIKDAARGERLTPELQCVVIADVLGRQGPYLIPLSSADEFLLPWPAAEGDPHTATSAKDVLIQAIPLGYQEGNLYRVEYVVSWPSSEVWAYGVDYYARGAFDELERQYDKRSGTYARIIKERAVWSQQLGDAFEALDTQADMINLVPDYGIEIGEIQRWKIRSWGDATAKVVDVGTGADIVEHWRGRLHPAKIKAITEGYMNDILCVTETLGTGEVRWGYDTVANALEYTYSDRRPLSPQMRTQADMINIAPDWPVEVDQQWWFLNQQVTIVDVGDADDVVKRWADELSDQKIKHILVYNEPVVLVRTAGGAIAWVPLSEFVDNAVLRSVRVADILNTPDIQWAPGTIFDGAKESLGVTIEILGTGDVDALRARYPGIYVNPSLPFYLPWAIAARVMETGHMFITTPEKLEDAGVIPPRTAAVRQADMINAPDVQNTWSIGDRYIWGRPDDNSSRWQIINRGMYGDMRAKYDTSGLTLLPIRGHFSPETDTWVSRSLNAYNKLTKLLNFDTPVQFETDMNSKWMRRTADMINLPDVRGGEWQVGDRYKWGYREDSTWEIVDIGLARDMEEKYMGLGGPVWDPSSGPANWEERVWVSRRVKLDGTLSSGVQLDTQRGFENDVRSGQMRRTADMINMPNVQRAWDIGDKFYDADTECLYTVIDVGVLSAMRQQYPQANAWIVGGTIGDEVVVVSRGVDNDGETMVVLDTLRALDHDLEHDTIAKIADMINLPGMGTEWPVGTTYLQGSQGARYMVIDIGPLKDMRLAYPAASDGNLEHDPHVDETSMVWVSQAVGEVHQNHGAMWFDTPRTFARDLEHEVIHKLADMINAPDVRGWSIGDRYVWHETGTVYTITDGGTYNQMVERYPQAYVNLTRGEYLSPDTHVFISGLPRDESVRILDTDKRLDADVERGRISKVADMINAPGVQWELNVGDTYDYGTGGLVYRVVFVGPWSKAANEYPTVFVVEDTRIVSFETVVWISELIAGGQNSAESRYIADTLETLQRDIKNGELVKRGGRTAEAAAHHVGNFFITHRGDEEPVPDTHSAAAVELVYRYYGLTLGELDALAYLLAAGWARVSWELVDAQRVSGDILFEALYLLAPVKSTFIEFVAEYPQKGLWVEIGQRTVFMGRARDFLDEDPLTVTAAARQQPVFRACAIRLPDGRIYEGEWHVECYRQFLAEEFPDKYRGDEEYAYDEMPDALLNHPQYDEGFITRRGEFVTREEAARMVGLPPEAGEAGELYNRRLLSSTVDVQWSRIADMINIPLYDRRVRWTGPGHIYDVVHEGTLISLYDRYGGERQEFYATVWPGIESARRIYAREDVQQRGSTRGVLLSSADSSVEYRDTFYLFMDKRMFDAEFVDYPAKNALRTQADAINIVDPSFVRDRQANYIYEIVKQGTLRDLWTFTVQADRHIMVLTQERRGLGSIRGDEQLIRMWGTREGYLLDYAGDDGIYTFYLFVDQTMMDEDYRPVDPPTTLSSRRGEADMVNVLRGEEPYVPRTGDRVHCDLTTDRVYQVEASLGAVPYPLGTVVKKWPSAELWGVQFDDDRLNIESERGGGWLFDAQELKPVDDPSGVDIPRRRPRNRTRRAALELESAVGV